jgi:His-Xaa-Ser system protein HxsD
MSDTGGIEYSLDDLGECATICVDTRVFSEASILKTAYWLTDEYYIYLSRDKKEPAIILSAELRLKEPSENSRNLLAIACRKFSNQLIDQEVRQFVQTETSVLRDTLVKKAFFEGHPRPTA